MASWQAIDPGGLDYLRLGLKGLLTYASVQTSAMSIIKVYGKLMHYTYLNMSSFCFGSCWERLICCEDKHEGCSSGGGLCAAVVAGACVLCSIINPLSIASAASGSTEMTMQADDSQISWTVPVAVTFAVNGDGTFQVPTNGQFTNNSVFDIHVSNIAVSTPSGVNLAKTSTITSSTAADTIGFTVTPGSGTAIEVADYTTAAAPATVADWVISAGGSLATSYTGKMSSYGSLNPSSAVKVATITWTAAAGDGHIPYSGPSLADSSVAVSLTLAQLQEAKADSAQAANLEAYAQSAKLQVQVPMADSTTQTATLIEDNSAGLTFMMDANVVETFMNSSGATANSTFGETMLHTALQSGGSVYNLFDASFLSAITPQNVKVASVYNETDGALTTLSNQTLWLPAAYDISGTDYESGYTAGSSAEATFGHKFEGLDSYAAGDNTMFWLRSAYYQYSNFWMCVEHNNDVMFGKINGQKGARPCFTL